MPADLFTYGPTLTSISPASGSTAGGTQVTVTGTGFSTVTHVKFGTTTAASYTVRSATQISATAPAHAAGTVAVSVTTAAGTTPTTVHDVFKFIVPVPVVAGVSPASGPAAGGTTVTVSGSGLSGATTVFFGASKGKTVSVNAGGTQLTVKSPSGTSGVSVDVQVVTTGGASAVVPGDVFTSADHLLGVAFERLDDRWHPGDHRRDRVLDSYPRQVRHNSRLGLHGQVAHPDLGHRPCPRAGTVRISVTTVGGTTPTSSADLYKFVVLTPAVGGVSPSSGPTAGGTTVTVSGSNLSGATTVLFGTAKGKTVSVNAGGTQLTVKSPAGTAGATVDIRVKTSAGESPP